MVNWKETFKLFFHFGIVNGAFVLLHALWYGQDFIDIYPIGVSMYYLILFIQIPVFIFLVLQESNFYYYPYQKSNLKYYFILVIMTTLLFGLLYYFLLLSRGIGYGDFILERAYYYLGIYNTGLYPLFIIFHPLPIALTSMALFLLSKNRDHQLDDDRSKDTLKLVGLVVLYMVFHIGASFIKTVELGNFLQSILQFLVFYVGSSLVIIWVVKYKEALD